MLKVCGVAIIVAIMGYVLSELGFKGKRAFSVLCTVILLLVFSSLVSDLMEKITGFSLDKNSQRLISSALKITGIGHAFGISSDICSELSEGGVASVLALIGKLEIALIIIPYIGELMEYATRNI